MTSKIKNTGYSIKEKNALKKKHKREIEGMRRIKKRELQQLKNNIRKAYAKHHNYQKQQYKLYKKGKITIDEYWKRYDRSWKLYITTEKKYTGK